VGNIFCKRLKDIDEGCATKASNGVIYVVPQKFACKMFTGSPP
jgi:hypothetical protein